jgi:hypothetical protein
MMKLYRQHKDISTVSEVCTMCKNFNGENPSARTCSAFPSGIPLAIWNGENNHTEPYENDGGILFESYQMKQAA